MNIPRATYRLQFHAGFGFRDAQGIVDYLADLGISDLYASPVFKAKEGSMHGYDVADPTELNPELGTRAELRSLAAEVQKAKMGWLQDVVPNHMAFDCENKMLMDVLEIGEASLYYNYFDIDWRHSYEAMKGRLLAPFLGKSYGECMRDREITIKYSEAGFTVHYYTWALPLKIESYATILSLNLDQLRKRLGREHPNFIKFMGVLYALQTFSDLELSMRWHNQRKFAKQMLWELYESEESCRQFIDRNLEELNGTVDSQTPNILDELLFEQVFRLSFWKVASEEINYRRFFTVNELISVRIEDEAVFNDCHSLIFKLVKEGVFTGLRIDHIDGLYDPQGYLQRLQKKTGGIYVAVEKILALDERLPFNWEAEGTSGYDALNILNGLFCDRRNKKAFERLYTSFIGAKTDFEELLYDRKQVIIERYMTGDLENLAHLMKRASSRDREGWDITLYGLKRAIREVLVQFPVYRTYIQPDSLTDTDRRHIIQAVASARRRSPDLVIELDYLEKFLLPQFGEHFDSEQQKDRLHFIMRFQQFTGPLMAKGFEDTTMYVFNQLVSLNEVGGEPNSFGILLDRFHEFNHRRVADWPHSMTATSTHDTKRSEDVRARINVLSEIPREWEARVKAWRSLNRGKKKRAKRKTVPDANDEYFFYQTLVGAYPFDREEHSELVERIKEYIIKAIREAKIHTGWLKPDNDYEEAYLAFIDKVLEPSGGNDFMEDFLPFQRKVAHYGILNSLSQTLLKICMPGVPDFYQGTEVWSLTLVDPDNRRPVDYVSRRALLNEIRSHESAGKYLQDIMTSPADGRIKLFLTFHALQARQRLAALFEAGSYSPLGVDGPLKEHVIAFARRQDSSWAITITPRFCTSLVEEGRYPVGKELWSGTSVRLPEGGPAHWEDAITSTALEAREGRIEIGDALQLFPAALLYDAE